MSFSADERNKELFRHMVEAFGHITRYTEGYSKSEFLMDEKTQDAVAMRLQQVLECASKLSSEMKSQMQIDWPSMVAMRNKISHAYVDVDSEIVWDVISEFEEFKKLMAWAKKNI